MFRKSFVAFRIRTLIAEYGSKNYDLARVTQLSEKKAFTVHLRYPNAAASSPAGMRRHHGSSSSSLSAAEGGGLRKRPEEVVLLEALPSKHVGLFKDGSIVAFDMSLDEISALRLSLKQCELPKEEALIAPRRVTRERQYTLLEELPSMGYEAPEGVGLGYIDEGELNAVVLSSNDPTLKLPYIYCLGELIQIEALNATLTPIAQRVGEWQEHVKRTGHLPCSLKQARIARAQLHRLQSKQTTIENRQQIFWDGQYNHLRSLYNDAYDIYEVPHLNAALNARVEVVADSVSYLSEETHAETNHRLEWVIIILIFMELMNAILTH